MPPGAKNSCKLGRAPIAEGRVVESGAGIGAHFIIVSRGGAVSQGVDEISMWAETGGKEARGSVEVGDAAGVAGTVFVVGKGLAVERVGEAVDTIGLVGAGNALDVVGALHELAADVGGCLRCGGAVGGGGPGIGGVQTHGIGMDVHDDRLSAEGNFGAADRP